ncbi:PTS lactose/cellobiose transporter subunit IIA [Clostridium tarantellae]|uniref:PTS lactose/cellobiose transporter subunit IIA n=1 Tax=Clostridium tarantellae TaxID=39493 RepID=A0A6I1MRN6_9CLOT|nr:PTS lactose/cellobiose transporter subunit IIA [Clostridium tarantellae]MPQ42939.1 PTS lactose/cellobiose transporter subunit IIA [Clostridium tarantellae]
MENLELVSFKIISSVGMAKSSYIESMKMVENGDLNLANEKIKEGDKFFTEGHNAHSELIQQEANGNSVTPTILLMHAEDQLMSAEIIKIMAKEIIKLNGRIQNLEDK